MGKPKTPKPPPPPAPVAIQDVSAAPADDAVKAQRRRSGYQKTVLTGNLTPMNTGKKTTLG